MPESTAYVEYHEDHAVVVHRDGARKNPLSPEYYAAIHEGLEAVQTRPELGALMLVADGYFCAGGNLNQLVERRQLPLHERKARIDQLNQLCLAIRHCPKPVIAAVKQGAAGAGVSLAFACDLVLADRQAQFHVAYVKVGLVPDGGCSYFLRERLPRPLAMSLALTGDPISAQRLYDLGALYALHDVEEVQAEAHKLAQRLARGPSGAIGQIKQLIDSAPEHSLAQHMQHERDAMAEALGSDEAQAGIQAFLDKRPARFPKPAP